ncbi:hypothetical protein [Marinimicrobium sp. ABcell2]|uniref:hypothetical protein n=1 Tax=Marinimicrobium sp. ABcell2 TaxID=3069751 RepID=UPI0027B0000D|nr:hypothetical protein [Marinimicrobium sp. ABcell2]MDQ2075156.1 hypothetical protein [Marinimicrobium sp. ABcell2]
MRIELVILGFVMLLIAAGIWLIFNRRSALFYLIGVFSLLGMTLALVAFEDRSRERSFERQQVEMRNRTSRLASEDSFFVFVENPISVEQTENPKNEGAIVYNHRFELTYRVLKPIWGNYNDDQISFTLYDHYGEPAVLFRRYSLIFLTKLEGKWAHEKYQWYPLNKTAEGDWAYCGDPTPAEWEGQPAKLFTIEFSPPVTRSVHQYTEEYVDRVYPKEIWERSSEFVACKAGVYPDELFRLKAEGVLRSRGLFP